MRKEYSDTTLYFERNGLWFTFQTREDGQFDVKYNEYGGKPEIMISSAFSMHGEIASLIARKIIYKVKKTYESALEYKGIGMDRFVNRNEFTMGLNICTNTVHMLSSTGFTFMNILSSASRHTAGITIQRNLSIPMIAWILILTTTILVIVEIKNDEDILSYLDSVSIYIGMLLISATVFSLSTNTDGSIRNLLRFKASFSSISQLRKHFNLTKNEIDTVLYLCPHTSQIVHERNASFIPGTKTGHLIMDERVNTSNTIQRTGFIITNYYYDFRTKRFWLIKHDGQTSKLLDTDLISVLRKELEEIEKLRQSHEQLRSESQFLTECTLQSRIITNLGQEISARENKWRLVIQNFNKLESAGISYNYFLD